MRIQLHYSTGNCVISPNGGQKDVCQTKFLTPQIFTFDICVNCIKGKQNNKRRFEANKTMNILELIHTDICGHSLTTWIGQQYFMTYVNNFFIMTTYISSMKSHNLRICSKILRLKLKINSTKESKVSNLTIVVNNMTDMMVQMNNIQDHLLNSQKNVVSSHSILCCVHPL